MKKNNRNVFILVIGRVDEKVTKRLLINLSKIFETLPLSFELIENNLDLLEREYFNNRGQYNSSMILDRIMEKALQFDAFRILGIIDKDIFASDLNYVFGVASSPKTKMLLRHGVCLISIKRLKEKYYNRQEDKVLFHQRVFKEAIHELGHTFGLSHCHNECVMRFSNRLGHTDDKPAEFCNSCFHQISKFFSRNNYF